MDSFGDQLSSIESKSEKDLEEDSEEGLEEDLEEVKQLLTEMTVKCSQMVSFENKDKHISTLFSTEDTEHTNQQKAQNNIENQNSTQIESQNKMSNEVIDEVNGVIESKVNELVADNEVTQTVEESIPPMIRKKTEMKFSKTDKWGETLAVFDERGVQRRVLAFHEINNYLKLELNSNKSGFDYYCSLISDRFPRFYSATNTYFQRWRMRYNIFVDKAFESSQPSGLLHIGEIHMYFDLTPRSSEPSYVNNSFFPNTLSIERPVSDERFSKIRKTFDKLRMTPEFRIFLKFPIGRHLFKNCNQVFDKFMDRQTDFVEEAQSVYRKSRHNRRFNWDSDRGRGRSQSFAGFQRFRRSDSKERESKGNDRNVGQSNREFDANVHKEREFTDNRDLGRNERSFGRSNRGLNRNNRGMKRDFGINQNSRDMPLNRGFDSDMSFEDTRERHESDANKSNRSRARRYVRYSRNKGVNESNASRSGPNFEDNSYGNDCDDRQFGPNRRPIAATDRRDFSAQFRDKELNANRNKLVAIPSQSQFGSGFGSGPQNLNHSNRSNTGNNFRQ